MNSLIELSLIKFGGITCTCIFFPLRKGNLKLTNFFLNILYISFLISSIKLQTLRTSNQFSCLFFETLPYLYSVYLRSSQLCQNFHFNILLHCEYNSVAGEQQWQISLIVTLHCLCSIGHFLFKGLHSMCIAFWTYQMKEGKWNLLGMCHIKGTC